MPDRRHHDLHLACLQALGWTDIRPWERGVGATLDTLMGTAPDGRRREVPPFDAALAAEVRAWMAQQGWRVIGSNDIYCSMVTMVTVHTFSDGVAVGAERAAGYCRIHDEPEPWLCETVATANCLLSVLRRLQEGSWMAPDA